MTPNIPPYLEKKKIPDFDEGIAYHCPGNQTEPVNRIASSNAVSAKLLVV